MYTLEWKRKYCFVLVEEKEIQNFLRSFPELRYFHLKQTEKSIYETVFHRKYTKTFFHKYLVVCNDLREGPV